jgi:hypothetical protein
MILHGVNKTHMSLIEKKDALLSKIKDMQANRKGIYAIDLLLAGAVGLMVLALVVVVVLIILGQMSSNTTLAPVNSSAANSINLTSTAVATIPTWFTIIITVVVAVGLITLVLVIRNITGGARE